MKGLVHKKTFKTFLQIFIKKKNGFFLCCDTENKPNDLFGFPVFLTFGCHNPEGAVGHGSRRLPSSAGGPATPDHREVQRHRRHRTNFHFYSNNNVRNITLSTFPSDRGACDPRGIRLCFKRAHTRTACSRLSVL